MFLVFSLFLAPRPHIEHVEHARNGVFDVFGLILTSPSPPSRQPVPHLTPHIEHIEHTLWGVFDVFDILLTPFKPIEHALLGVFNGFVVLLTPTLMSNTQNTPHGRVLGVQRPPLLLLPSQHPKHGFASVSGVGWPTLASPSPSTPTWKTRHDIAFSMLAGSPPATHEKHALEGHVFRVQCLPHLTHLPINTKNATADSRRVFLATLHHLPPFPPSLSPVLFDAPQIPAGIHLFQWIPVEWDWNLQELNKIHRNGTESSGMGPESTGMAGFHWNDWKK